MTITNAAGAKAASEPERLQRDPRRRDTALLLAALAVLVAVETVLFVFAYLPSERVQAVEAWKGRLVALADDREAALAAWGRERVGDAHVVAAYPTVAALAAAGAGAVPPTASGEGTGTHLAGLLDAIVVAYRYQGAYVLDARGAEVASSTGSPPLCEACLAAARETLAAGVTTLDFYLRSDGTPLIAVMAPVATFAPEAAARAPAGAVVLTADPRSWVYPMLAAQPLPTSTGEAVLVRREGDGVRFLSPLRNRQAAPLASWRPLDTHGFASQEAVEGHQGFFATADYRGVPVFAATRLVAGTPWGLVVKVDRSEALALFRSHARVTAVFLALITAALALAGVGLWRSRRARYEAALARSETRFADLFEHANDAVVVSRPDGRIVAVNPRAEALYGHSRAELLALAIRDLRAPETRPQLGSQMRQVLDGEGLVFETVHLANDGVRIPVEVSSRRVDWEGGPALFSLVRDIRERRDAEERIRFLNRVLRTISEVNQLVVRERDRDALFAETCRILVEHGEFHMAWVGLAEPESGRVRPVAVAGFDDGYLDASEVRFDDSPAGRGPTGTAIRERRPVVVNDWERDERMVPWRAAGRERGYRSSAAAPLESGGAAIGAVTIYADRPGVFTDEIVKLLVELAGDLSFALVAIEAEQKAAAATAALAASETRFRALYERSPLGYQSLDAEGRFIDVNPAWVEALGYPAEEVVGRWFGDFLAPAYVEKFRANFPRFVAEGEIHGIEFEMVRKDGAHVAMAFDGRTGRDERGAFKQTHCILADVTERKRTQEALQESEERFRSFFDNAPIGKAITFPDGRVFRVNPALCQLLGYRAVELEGLSFEAITYPEDIPASREGLRSLLAGERSSWAIEKRYVARDGRIIWTHAVVALQRDRDGRPLHFLTHVLDVTERQRAEEARSLLAAVVESSDDAVIAKRLDGTILSWNPGAERLYGYTAEEAVGRNISILAPPEGIDEVRSILARVARGEAVTHYETVRVRKDGTRAVVSLAVSPIMNSAGGILGASTIARDITERKHAEEALREARDLLEARVADRTAELKAANAELEAFSYSVSHDLRAPLRSIDGFSRIVEEEYGGRLDDEGRRLLRVVRDNTHRMAQLIDDLLAFSRSARHPLQPARVDMGALVRSVYEEVVSPEARAGRELTVGALPDAVGDVAMLRQVWVNLLANAVKFTGPAAQAAIAVSGRRDGDEVVYAVSDNGVGFDMTYAGKLFGVFQRLHPASQFEGTGVGLALVQRIVHRHGGRVWADGAVGKGATFSFALPVPGGTS